jgi:hypothetical protein
MIPKPPEVVIPGSVVARDAGAFGERPQDQDHVRPVASK